MRNRFLRLANGVLAVNVVAVATLPTTMLLSPAQAADVSVSNAWIRALPRAVPSGGYFTLHNGGSKTATLTGAESPGCGMVMLHKSEDRSGMGSMTDVNSIDIAVGETLRFAPGGYHLMCMDATAAIKPDNSVPVTLLFKDGRKLLVPFQVRNANGKP